MTTVYSTDIPDNLLVDGTSLQHLTVRFSAIPESPKKDLIVFLDNSSISKIYHPKVKPLLAEWVQKTQPDCFLADGLAFSNGVKNLLFSNDPEENAQKIRDVLHTDTVDEINLAEPFHTLNAYLDSKIEKSVLTRTTIVFVLFSSATSANPEFGTKLREFLKRVVHMPVDVHVVAFGGLQPASLYNMLTGLGSLTGSYQALVLDFEPEKTLLNRSAGGDSSSETVDKLIAKHGKSIEREFRQSLETLSTHLRYCDNVSQIGAHSSRLMRVSIRGNTSMCILPKCEKIIAGFGDNIDQCAIETLPWDDTTARRCVLLSVKLVLNNLEKYTRDGKIKNILKNLTRSKNARRDV